MKTSNQLESAEPVRPGDASQRNNKYINDLAVKEVAREVINEETG